MSSENERLKILREALNIRQGDFADKISTTQGHISDIENGRKRLSERTVKLISLVNWNGEQVNEKWLLTGEGEMFIKYDSDRELNIQVARLVGGGSEFKKTMISMMLKMSEEQWKLVEDFVDTLYLAKQKENTRDE